MQQDYVLNVILWTETALLRQNPSELRLSFLSMTYIDFLWSLVISTWSWRHLWLFLSPSGPVTFFGLKIYYIALFFSSPLQQNFSLKTVYVYLMSPHPLLLYWVGSLSLLQWNCFLQSHHWLSCNQIQLQSVAS